MAAATEEQSATIEDFFIRSRLSSMAEHLQRLIEQFKV